MMTSSTASLNESSVNPAKGVYLWAFDAELRFTELTGPYSTLAGCSFSEHLGRRLWEFLETRMVEGDWASLKARLAAREPFAELTLQRRRRDGQMRYFRMSGAPVMDADGRFTGYRGTARDCTVEMAVELSCGAALRQIASMVRHDLRAPVRAIDGFTQILKESHLANLAAEGRDCVERIGRCTENLSALLHGLGEFIRVAEVVPRAEWVDVAGMAQRIARELKGRYAREPRFTTTVMPKAWADPGLLEHVLRQLMDNAWKFSAGRDEPVVELAVQSRDSAGVVYGVRDNGIGFAAEHAHLLFQPFQRLSSARGYPGHGAGLMIVKRAMEQLAGRVWAENHNGEGATFCFSLGARPGMRES